MAVNPRTELIMISSPTPPLTHLRAEGAGGSESLLHIDIDRSPI